jgi:hypothetical protein
MRRLVLAIVVAVGTAAALPSAAGSQPPARDSVSGSVTVAVAAPIRNGGLTFDASSGPSGEDPTGTVTVAFLDFNVILDFQVTCLAVNGNAAIVGARHVDSALGEQLEYEQIVDGGPGQPDKIGVISAGSAFDCARPPQPFVTTSQITSGDLVVTDAQAYPLTRDACKNGHWRDFGVFESQGGCVSFVATGGKHAPRAR